MPATSKAYFADDADTFSPTLTQREEDAIARFLDQTDHLLAAVVAAFIVCIGAIAFGG